VLASPLWQVYVSVGRLVLSSDTSTCLLRIVGRKAGMLGNTFVQFACDTHASNRVAAVQWEVARERFLRLL